MPRISPSCKPHRIVCVKTQQWTLITTTWPKWLNKLNWRNEGIGNRKAVIRFPPSETKNHICAFLLRLFSTFVQKWNMPWNFQPPGCPHLWPQLSSVSIQVNDHMRRSQLQGLGREASQSSFSDASSPHVCKRWLGLTGHGLELKISVASWLSRTNDETS